VLIDALIVVLVGLMMVAGFRRGLVVSAAGIACVAGGGAVGGLAGALFGARGTLVGVLVCGLGGGVAFTRVMQRVDEWVADHVEQDLRQFDRAFGAVLNGLVGLAIAWVFAAVLTVVPVSRGVADQVKGSSLVGALVGVVPPTGDLASLVLRSGLVPATAGPLVLTSTPDDSIVTAPGVVATEPSVLQVVGRACNLIVTGTAWVEAPDTVVTNAHVVAGMQRVFVRSAAHTPGAETNDNLRDEVDQGTVGAAAQVDVFDPQDDVAILTVPGLNLPPLRMADVEPAHDTSSAVVGFPKREGENVTSARYDRELTWPSSDIYNQRRLPVPVASFGGGVLSGNSGSPLETADGEVVATVEASTVGQSVQGGFAVPNDVVRRLATQLGTNVDTGPCITDAPGTTG
jgi:hypothetical protein